MKTVGELVAHTLVCRVDTPVDASGSARTSGVDKSVDAARRSACATPQLDRLGDPGRPGKVTDENCRRACGAHFR